MKGEWYSVQIILVLSERQHWTQGEGKNRTKQKRMVLFFFFKDNAETNSIRADFIKTWRTDKKTHPAAEQQQNEVR